MKSTPIYYLRHALSAGIVSLTALAGGVHASTLDVDYTSPYQEMEGFGTCSIGWQGNMDTFYATQSFLDLYITEAGMSMYRMPIWPRVLDSVVANAADIKYQNFTDTNTRAKSYIDMVLRLKNAQPEIRIIMTSWAPPGWMKASGNINGGNPSTNYLLPKYYDHFAVYLVEWLKYFKEKYSIDAYAISFQNELRFDEPYESCIWTPAQYLTFIKIFGPKMDAAGFGDVLIFGPEHMTSRVDETMDFINAIDNDPEAKSYLDVVATHGYTDGIAADTNPASASAMWAKIGPLGYKFWMTETSGESTTFNGALDGVAGSIHNAIVGGNCSAYVYWQGFESSPSAFCLRGTSTNNAKWDAFKHFSKFVRPGMHRIGSSLDASTKKVDVSAYADDTTKKVTIVMLNRNVSDIVLDMDFANNPGLTSLEVYRTTATTSFAKQSNLSISDEQTVSITLPARSLTTLTGTAKTIEFPIYTLDTDNLEIPAGSSSITIAVSSNLDFASWAATSNVSWLSFSAEGGTGNGSVVLTAKRNTNLVADRIGTVQIAGKTVSITQAVNPGLTLIGWKSAIGKAGGAGSIEIESLGSAASSAAWTAESDADWVTIDNTSGTGKDTVTYTVSVNDTGLARTANLSIADQPYVIIQSGGNGSIFPAGGDSGYLENVGYYYDGFYPFIWLWGEADWIWVAGDDANLESGFFFWQFGQSRWCWTKQGYFPYYYPFIGNGFGDPVELITGL